MKIKVELRYDEYYLQKLLKKSFILMLSNSNKTYVSLLLIVLTKDHLKFCKLSIQSIYKNKLQISLIGKLKTNKLVFKLFILYKNNGWTKKAVYNDLEADRFINLVNAEI